MNALRLSGFLMVLLVVAACAGGAVATPPLASHAPGASTSVGASTPVGSTPPSIDATSVPVATSTPEPADSGGSTTGGDIPDNAVFLTYADAPHAFSVDYVEGWQVTPNTDGVVIRDKDSSETIQVVPTVSDVAAYIAATDLPQLQSLSGFQLDKQDTVKVNGSQLNHLVYHAPSPPDPVTGKEVPSTIDRYYVPGASGLAIVTLSTPDGVDNVDAFRQMIQSFTWT